MAASLTDERRRALSKNRTSASVLPLWPLCRIRLRPVSRTFFTFFRAPFRRAHVRVRLPDLRLTRTEGHHLTSLVIEGAAFLLLLVMVQGASTATTRAPHNGYRAVPITERDS